jgi:hypothetical protein
MAVRVREIDVIVLPCGCCVVTRPSGQVQDRDAAALDNGPPWD